MLAEETGAQLWFPVFVVVVVVVVEGSVLTAADPEVSEAAEAAEAQSEESQPSPWWSQSARPSPPPACPPAAFSAWQSSPG